MDRPNILFLFADDQRFDTISALGNPAIRTPNLDRLVRRGEAFTHAHIPCGTSGAVCMPSRAMLHSGRRLFHISGAGRRIPEDHTTLGEAFRAAGYTTFGSGKWHNGAAAYHRSFSDGDEIFFGGMADHWNMPAHHYDPTGRYASRLPYIEGWQLKRDVRYRNADHIPSGRHSSEVIADAGVAFLERAGRDAPFLMYLSFLAPHDPRSMPAEYLAMYDPDDMDLPANVMGGHPFDNGVLHIRDEELAGFPRTREEVRVHLAEYYAMITHLDAQIGRVLDALDAQGLADGTIVVFAGDNGLAVGQHGLMGKQSCYEHSVRVPLIFSGPGIPAGVRTEAYAYLFDVFPTLCDLAGIAIPESVEGTSLVPALEDPKQPVRDDLYFAYTDLHRAVKDRRYKLIEYVLNGKRTETQLFDLQEDPLELRNLAHDSAQADRLAAMRARLVELRDDWDDRAGEWGRRFWEAFEG